MSRPWAEQFAHHVADLGWYTFPLRAMGKEPPSGLYWKQASTTDHDTIHQWWHRSPSLNVGLDLGKSGLFAVDVDVKLEDPPKSKHYVPTMEGYHDVAALFAKHQWWPPQDGYRVVSGSGGWHILFQQSDPPVRGRTQKGHRPPLGAHVDIKSAGGYLVAPGSVIEPEVTVWNADGRYRRESDAGWDLPAIPDWLRLLVDPPKPPPTPLTAARTFMASRDMAKGGWEAVVADYAKVADHRNDALNSTAYRLRGILTRADGPTLREVVQALGQASETNGLVSDDGRRKVANTIASGLDVRPETVEAML